MVSMEGGIHGLTPYRGSAAISKENQACTSQSGCNFDGSVRAARWSERELGSQSLGLTKRPLITPLLINRSVEPEWNEKTSGFSCRRMLMRSPDPAVLTKSSLRETAIRMSPSRRRNARRKRARHNRRGSTVWKHFQHRLAVTRSKTQATDLYTAGSVSTTKLSELFEQWRVIWALGMILSGAKIGARSSSTNSTAHTKCTAHSAVGVATTTSRP